jgi:hypothetical protein
LKARDLSLLVFAANVNDAVFKITEHKETKAVVGSIFEVQKSIFADKTVNVLFDLCFLYRADIHSVPKQIFSAFLSLE